MAPGTKYPTLDAAGIQAILDILTKSICTSTEYASVLYQNADGTYSYTAPRPGSAYDAEIDPAAIPTGLKFSGDYHTHGAYDPNIFPDYNNTFSPGDKAGNDNEPNGLLKGLPGYLGGTNQAILKYTPNIVAPLMGKIDELVPPSKTPCDCRGVK